MEIDTVLLDSVKKSNKLVDQIIADKKYHKKELLQPVIDAMDELIQLAEAKLEIFNPLKFEGIKNRTGELTFALSLQQFYELYVNDENSHRW